jgi:hypothetical protein
MDCERARLGSDYGVGDVIWTVRGKGWEVIMLWAM